MVSGTPRTKPDMEPVVWRRPAHESCGLGKRKRTKSLPPLMKEGRVERLKAILFGGQNAAYDKVVRPALLFLRRSGLDPAIKKGFEATPFQSVFENGVYDSFCMLVNDAFNEDEEQIRGFLKEYCPDFANDKEQLNKITLAAGEYEQLWEHRLTRPLTPAEWQSIHDAYHWLLCATRKFYESGKKFPGSFQEFLPSQKSRLTAEGHGGETSRGILKQLEEQVTRSGISHDYLQLSELTGTGEIVNWVDRVLSLEGRVRNRSYFQSNHLAADVSFCTWADAVEFCASEVYEVLLWRAWRPLFMLSPWLFGGDGMKFMKIYAEYKLRSFKRSLDLQKESLCAFYRLGGEDPSEKESVSYKKKFDNALASVVTGDIAFAQRWATGSTMGLMDNSVPSTVLPYGFMDTTHHFIDTCTIQVACRRFKRICDIVKILHLVGDLLYKVSLERHYELGIGENETARFWSEVEHRTERFLRELFVTLHSVRMEHDLPFLEDLEGMVLHFFKRYWSSQDGKNWFLVLHKLPVWFQTEMQKCFLGNEFDNRIRRIYFEGVPVDVLDASCLLEFIFPRPQTFVQKAVFNVVCTPLQTLLHKYFVMRDNYYTMFEEVWDMGGSGHQPTWNEKIAYWIDGLE